jgi:hypothetical protein
VQGEHHARAGGLLYLSSHSNDVDQFMNAAIKDQVIGEAALFATFVFFSAIIAGLFS